MQVNTIRFIKLFVFIVVALTGKRFLLSYVKSTTGFQQNQSLLLQKNRNRKCENNRQ